MRRWPATRPRRTTTSRKSRPQASFEIAELYRQLGADLTASERPKKMSAEEREQYDLLLEERVTPIEEQAIALHEANAARARDGIYDDGVKASFGALAKLLPARFGKTELPVAWSETWRWRPKPLRPTSAACSCVMPASWKRPRPSSRKAWSWLPLRGAAQRTGYRATPARRVHRCGRCLYPRTGHRREVRTGPAQPWRAARYVHG